MYGKPAEQWRKEQESTVIRRGSPEVRMSEIPPPPAPSWESVEQLKKVESFTVKVWEPWVDTTDSPPPPDPFTA